MNQPGEKARGSGREPSRNWRVDASCRDIVDQYFDPWDSDDKDLEPSATAKQICGTCPVRRTCLIEAITNKEPYGTWGGLTLKQRKKLIRAQKRMKCPICTSTQLVLGDDCAQTCLSCGIAWRTIKPSHSAQPSSPEYQPMNLRLPATGTRTS